MEWFTVNLKQTLLGILDRAEEAAVISCDTLKDVQARYELTENGMTVERGKQMEKLRLTLDGLKQEAAQAMDTVIHSLDLEEQTKRARRALDTDYQTRLHVKVNTLSEVGAQTIKPLFWQDYFLEFTGDPVALAYARSKMDPMLAAEILPVDLTDKRQENIRRFGQNFQSVLDRLKTVTSPRNDLSASAIVAGVRNYIEEQTEDFARDDAEVSVSIMINQSDQGHPMFETNEEKTKQVGPMRFNFKPLKGREKTI